MQLSNNWTYFYPFRNAPTFSDLSIYLDGIDKIENNIDKIENKICNKIDTNEKNTIYSINKYKDEIKNINLQYPEK